MRLSVLCLFFFVLFAVLSQGAYSESHIVEHETTAKRLIRRQAASGHSDGGHSTGAQTGTTTGTTTVKQAAKASSIWASPPILQDGTLFYIAISISALLWCTGKGVDMSLDQQERRAEYQARR